MDSLAGLAGPTPPLTLAPMPVGLVYNFRHGSLERAGKGLIQGYSGLWHGNCGFSKFSRPKSGEFFCCASQLSRRTGDSQMGLWARGTAKRSSVPQFEVVRCRISALQAGTLLVFSIVASVANDAQATVIQGTISGNEIWSPVGNPYQLVGDTTVATGGSLSVEPGTNVSASPFDSLASGFSTSQVEFVIDGSLDLTASALSPIEIAPEAGQATNSWFGLVVNNGGTMSLSGGLTALDGDLQLASGSTLQASGNGGQLSATGDVSLGGAFQLQSNPTLVAVGTTINVLDLSGANSVAGTFFGLPEGGQFQVGDVTWQASYADGLTLQAVQIDIPEPVAPGGGGTPTPCATGAGTTVSGNLGGTTVFSCAGNPYQVDGDLTVQNGAALTVQAGVQVLPEASDSLVAGSDPAKVEINVDGVLRLESVVGAPSVLGPATNGTDGWVGVTVRNGATLENVNGGIIDGSLRFEDGATFLSEITDLASFQPLSIGGDLFLDGTLSLIFGSGFEAVLGDTLRLFDVADGRLLSGMFDNLAEGALLDFPMFALQITYAGGDGNDVVLSVVRAATSVPEPPAVIVFVFGFGLLGLLLFANRRAVGAHYARSCGWARLVFLK